MNQDASAPGFLNNDITPNTVDPAGYLCYINGRRVPIVSATVRSAVGDIPTATINFFPSRHLYRFGAEDRVEVVLFYLDTSFYTEPKYCLLFDGEIIAWNYSTSDESRHVSATAIADISILRQVNYAFWSTAGKLGVNTTSPEQTTGKAGVYAGPSLLRQGLIAIPGAGGRYSQDYIKRPYDLLDNVLVALCGSKNHDDKEIPRNDRPLALLNFFSRWARKRNFINRFVAAPHFDDYGNEGTFPLLRAYNNTEILGVLQNLVTDGAGDGSLYDVITQIYDSMYYELAMLMTPPAAMVNLKTGEIVSAAYLHLLASGTALPIPDLNPEYPVRLANYYAKPKMMFAVPPMCNVVLPSMVRGLTYAETYAGQATRLYLAEEELANWLNLQQNAPDEIAKIILSTAYPPEANQSMLNAVRMSDFHGATVLKIDQYNNARRNGKNVLIWPTEFFQGPLLANGMVPRLFSHYARTIAKGTNKDTASDAKQAVDTLLQLYAETEFYIRRYNKRVGSVDMVFNPYMIPGYPGVIFDRKNGLHHIGYIQEVQHELSPRGMSTQASYTAGRTLAEWLTLIKDDTLRLGTPLASAPADPIHEVRQKTQYIGTKAPPAIGTAAPQDADAKMRSAAKDHYDRLLYPGIDTDSWQHTGFLQWNSLPAAEYRKSTLPVSGTYKHSSVFDGSEMLRVRTADTGGQFKTFTWGMGAGAATTEKQGLASRNKGEKRTRAASAPQDGSILNLGLDDTAEVELQEKYAHIGESTTESMRLVSRPVCTIVEYVRFRNGLNGANYANSEDEVTSKFKTVSTRENGEAPVAAKLDKNTGARYFERIYALRYSSIGALDPTQFAEYSRSKVEEYVNSYTPVLVQGKGSLRALGRQYQLYRDWDAILDLYIKEVEGDTWPEES